MDPVDQVVMTETQKELLDEIKTQYERCKKEYLDTRGDPKDMTGKLTCFIPIDLLREAFEGQPPTK